MQYAFYELKGDKEVVLAAINQGGYALQFASDELNGYKWVVLAAINESEYALQCVYYKLKVGE